MTHTSDKQELSHHEQPDYVVGNHTKAPDAESADHSHEMRSDIDEGFDPAMVKRAMRKVDWRLIPMLSAMYCISLIDRTNLSVARAANGVQMDKDLLLREGGNNRYGLATLMFFIPYILLEIPSQFGLRKFGARWWLGTATILWGLVTVFMGYSQNWQTLVALRAVLGIFEATLFPGAAYLIACWYPRRNMATRNTFFYVTSIVISGLSSIMAYGISQMNGIQGKAGWRWIFIIQGALTCLIGVCGILFIIDFPDKSTFLTPEEKELVQTRIDRDRGDAVVDQMTMAKFTAYLCEPKIWLFGFFFGSSTLGSYSLAYFLPTILASMGFTNVLAQVLMAPPYVWAAVPAICCAYVADRYKWRAYAVMFNAASLIVGTCMYSQLDKAHKAARYAGIFLAIGGCNANVPLVLSWAQTSIRAQSKRGFTSALIVAWGGVGGILAGVVFMEKEARKNYPTGVYLTIAMNSCVFILAFCLRLFFQRQNKRADRGEILIEDSPDFRYQG